MTWASRRKFFYLLIAGAVVLFFIYLIAQPYLNKVPTCFDGRQNGEEVGVDCGGKCQVACIFEVDKLSVIWSRTFEVVPGRYNAVAYLENHNKDQVVNSVSYRFRFADKDNVYIGKRDGESYIPPSGKFAIFEPAIDLGNSLPVYTSFEFTQNPTWINILGEKVNQLKLIISDIKLEDSETGSKLSADIKNNSLFQIPEIKIIAILYDEKGNAVTSSQTYLDVLDGEENRVINFTWPKIITEQIVLKEIIPIFNIFSVKLK
ncbi:MAG: hypothetical protein ABH951_03165 [Patescibacteria group bacterium]